MAGASTTPRAGTNALAGVGEAFQELTADRLEHVGQQREPSRRQRRVTESVSAYGDVSGGAVELPPAVFELLFACVSP
jgi:hypothetical protein